MLHFLAQGDYNVPFTWPFYWIKHFYMWSFQSGASNPDGLIRLPGRVLNFIVFEAFGQMALSYFYIFSSLFIAGLAFFFFARNFLKVKELSIQLLGALFFALNPIFLGNVAKIGLVLAAAMLPFALLAIQKMFDTQKVRYFLLYVLCINISFIHPYTMTINLGLSFCYLVYKMWKHRIFVMVAWKRMAACVVFALLLNAYFILPIITMGTVSKDVISDSVTPIAADYTALVDISNTGNIFTGLSLSKNVFVDFNFYNSTYKTVYFIAVYAFYIVLLALYLRVQKRLVPAERRNLLIMLGFFLLFVALATTTFMGVDTVIRFIIKNVPGGWAFRSPLKWQLYIPIMLFGAMVVLLKHVITERKLRYLQVAFLVTFVLMNGYLATDLYKMILKPRTLNNFAALQAQNFNYNTMLFVNSNDCTDYMRSNPRIVTEFNQVLISKNLQLKRVFVDSIDQVNVGSYDYVMTCKDLAGQTANMLQNQYHFAKTDSFVGGIMTMYANKTMNGNVWVPKTVFGIDQAADISDKYNFVTSVLGQDFSFAANVNQPTTSLKDAFAGITPSNTKNGMITNKISLNAGSAQQLYIKQNNQPLYYNQAASSVAFSTTQKTDMQTLNAKTLNIPAGKEMNISYSDDKFSYKNLVKNPSLEDGLWQKNVSDCYAYDNDPAISMKLVNDRHTDGKNAVQLVARKHIACTGPQAVGVTPGAQYLVSFDYQSPSGMFAGFHVSFDDKKQTSVTQRMTQDGNGWHSFSKVITVPAGATKMRLQLYAYPQGLSGLTRNTTYYDNVSIMSVPSVQDRFYLVGKPATAVQQPQKLVYDIVNPTKKIAHITGAKQPFYLATAETYNKLWKAGLAQDDGVGWFNKTLPISSKNHFALNNSMNGWYIDPAALCAKPGAKCTKNADGSYSFDVVISYAGQRAVYQGLIISGVSLVAGAAYFGYDAFRNYREHHKGRYKWPGSDASA